MAFSRQPVAKLDRRRVLALRIIIRYTDHDRAMAWKAYVDDLKVSPKAALAYLKMRGSLPEQRKLDLMMAADG